MHPSSLSRVQDLASKVGEHEAGAVDIGVVVAAETLFLFAGPGAEGLADVAVCVLAADHEADLAGGVGGDGGVGVLDDGEDLLAGLLELTDQLEVKPLVFGWKGNTNPFRAPMGVGAGRENVSFVFFSL